MSATVFALADNSLPDLSHVSENSLDPPDSIRKRHAARVESALQQTQDATIGDSKSTERETLALTTLPGKVVDIDSIIALPSLPQVSQAQATFHAIQEWEGYVLEKGEREFTARLLDITAGSTQEEEEVTIPLAEISEDDLNRLRHGSVFRWVIGYERSVSKTKRHISQIVFRDLPAMTKQDLSEGEKWAKKIARSIVD